MYLTGIDPTVVSDTLNEDGSTYRPDHELGSLYADDAGKIFQYVKVGETFNLAGVAVVIDEDNICSQLDNVTTQAGVGQGLPVGIAVSLGLIGNYVWVQRHGPVDVISAATGAAAHTTLNSTATGGRLDDDGTAGAEDIPGVTLTATAASNVAPGIINWPFVGETN